MIPIANEIKTIFNLLKNKGYEIYIVGGYVRDSLLNKVSYDIDMTTSATPDILKEIFKNYKLNEEFMGFGSVKFELNEYHFEITTFRKEEDYKDYRKPEHIEFTTSLKEDLLRRDFTVNALCYDLENIIDIFDGIKDLKEKKINTIGDPFVRFKEDALRILRALRFSSKLGFTIGDQTKEAIKNTYKYLNKINYSTLLRELKGILEGENYIDVLNEYSQQLKEIFNLNDLKIELFKENMNEEEKEALFFYFSDKQTGNKYLNYKNLIFINDKIDLKYKLKKYGKEIIGNNLYFSSKYLNKDKDMYNLYKEIIDGKECFNLKMLKVNGNDLINLNIRNKNIGEYLEFLLNSVIENKCENNKEKLIEYLKNNKID